MSFFTGSPGMVPPATKNLFEKRFAGSDLQKLLSRVNPRALGNHLNGGKTQGRKKAPRAAGLDSQKLLFKLTFVLLCLSGKNRVRMNS